MTESTSSPESYIRINITKTSRSYNYETTVSLRWTPVFGYEHGRILRDMLRESDRLAREEIAVRTSLDAAF